jgi:hypothetical protein
MFEHLLESTGKYRRVFTPDGKVRIAKDPNYSLARSVIETNRIQKIALIATAIISLITLIVAYLDYKKDSVISVTPPSVTILPLQQQPKQDSIGRNTEPNQVHQSDSAN